MDFRLNAEQLALQATTKAFCADQVPLAEIARYESQRTPEKVWTGLGELGLFSLLGEPHDNAGVVEAVVAFEVLGQALVPGPLLWSALSAEFAAAVGEGDLRATGLEAPGAGAVAVVPHADSDLVLVLHANRVELLESSKLPQGRSGTPLDPLTPFTGYSTLPLGEVVGDATVATRVRLRGAALSAAMLVGLAQGALDTARGYALEREQFGKPIGSFQAIKHLLADMFVRVELARSASYAAAATIADPRAGESGRSTSAAKLLAGEAALANSRAAIQILGGMGFTWEMLPHYYLKRAWVLENAFGTSGAHALLVADGIDAEVAA